MLRMTAIYGLSDGLTATNRLFLKMLFDLDLSRQTDMQTGMQTDRQTNRQTCRQTDRQTLGAEVTDTSYEKRNSFYSLCLHRTYEV